MRLIKSKRGVTPVIAIILLLMMTVAAAGAAYLWITKISESMKSSAEKDISSKLQSAGQIEFVSQYACELNSDYTNVGCQDGSGNCIYPACRDEHQTLFSSEGVENDPKSPCWNQTADGKKTKAVKREGHLCLLVRNQESSILRLVDIGSSTVTYELPDSLDMGARPIMGSQVGLRFDTDDGPIFCTFADLADGKCKGKQTIQPREIFEIAFPGDFRSQGDSEPTPFKYTECKNERIILHINLPSGYTLNQQIT